jgi:hypothetical protein
MGLIGFAAATAIKKRAFMRGHGADDKPHKAYSTRPIYISKRGNTGKRLKPKGGKDVGGSVFYAGGYKSYKKQSTTGSRGGGRSGVNLTLSGQLLRSIKVTKVTADRVVIKMTGKAAAYGAMVDKARPFFGISEKDSAVIAALFKDVLSGHSRKSMSKGGTLMVGADRFKI